MHIAAYVNPLTVGQTETGVSKHVRNMVLELSRRKDADLTLLSPRREWMAATGDGIEHPFANLPVSLLPGRRSWLEKAWSMAGMPRVDRWCRGADWVYCPMEAYVATARPRLAVTVHCMNPFERELPWYAMAGRERRRWQLKLGRAFQKDDVLILAVSEFLKGRLVYLFNIRPERIAVVGNGAEPAYYDVEGDTPADAEKKYLLVVGGLTQRKGGDETLRVAEILRRRNSGLEIWVAGKSEPEYVTAAGAQPNVKHLGYRGVSTGLPQLMRGAAALLFLSRYDTFGIPAVEAMAAGTPVIVSQYAGLPEVVGNAGLVVDSTRPDDVVDQILNLVDNHAGRMAWIEKGKRRSQDFTWERCADRLCRILAVGGPVSYTLEHAGV
jgi:glycosyltransferase involved in cell wall biosynthesis